MRKLIEYMPPFLKSIREFNKIFDAEDIEINNLNAKMNLLLTEVIVNSAESFGLDRYEKIYKINNASTNVEARRAAILTRINSKVPFTYKWLYYQLRENFGDDGFEINIDYDNYQIEIVIKSLSSEVADIFIQDLYKKIPANMQQSFRLVEKIDYNIAAIVVQKESNTLIIDNSIIKEELYVGNDEKVGMIVAQIEENKMIIDNSIIKEETSITQEQNLAGTIVQTENEILIIDASIINEEESINNDSYIASSIIQKENLKLKED